MELFIIGILLFIVLYIVYYLFENYSFAMGYGITILVEGFIVIFKNLNDDISDLIIKIFVYAAGALGFTVIEYIVYNRTRSFFTYLLVFIVMIGIAGLVMIKGFDMEYNQIIELIKNIV